MRLIKIEHWELSRMKQAMPEVVEQLRQKVEERTELASASGAAAAD